MKTLTLLVVLGLTLPALPALADRRPLAERSPREIPASYKAECGSCHLAYPPALLGAGDWQRILDSLDRHFGSDATLDAAKRQEIGAYLQSRAGDASRLARAGDPPRISQTARFTHAHDEVPARFWRDPRVKSAANCEACHRGAAQGRFNEHDIAIPELRE